MKINTLSVILFIVLFSQQIKAQQQGFGCISNMEVISFKGSEVYTNKANPIVNIPPIFGSKARKSDRNIPLPFGIGFHSIYYDQAYKASKLLLSSDSTSITARADTLYQNTTAYEFKGQIRPNIWVLPFLNVYGIYGYTKGVISPNLVVPYIVVENIPVIDSIVVDTTFEIHDEIGYVGPTYGIGATFSMGFRSFFIMADYNYSVTDPTDMDDNLHNHFFSPKIGIFIGKTHKKSYGALWVGGMFISNDQSFTGKIDVADINPMFVPLFGKEATYSGKISAVQQWNFIIGGSWVINNHHHFIIEAGFLERKQISFGYDFRF